MTAACPTCNAPITFRFDDSFVRVCEHCHSCVVRTDRGVDTLGAFADLAPIDSPIRLFSDGHDRNTSFLLVGMAQLRHAAGGTWQEWYAKLDGGEWGWLSEAQGRFYMTYEAPDVAAPPFMSLGPGATIAIAHGGHTRDYTVAELGSASYIGARGEIPYRLVPGAAFRFADLAAPDGSFVTIDYGDPADPNAQPTVYVGRQMTLAELQLTGGEAGPEPAQAGAKISASGLTCPNCGGSLDLHAPGSTLRIACPYCGTLADITSGAATLIAKQQAVPKPDLGLGTKGTFAEGEMQIIGYLKRSALVDGAWWDFDEYLLFAPAVGFRWLVNSDGHWSYVQPIAPGAVESHKIGQRYDGVKFRLYQTAQLRVDAVLGEMYWQVRAGDLVQSEDYIAPPAMLSVERSGSEESWSLSSYLTHAALLAALGNPATLTLPAATGVAPNQPARSGAAVQAMSFGLMALLALGLVFVLSAKHVRKFSDTITMPSVVGATAGSGSAAGSGAPDPITSAYFSAPFQLVSNKNIEITFQAALGNDWAYAAADLVETKTGTVTSVDAELEHYSGVEDGESWSEGDPSASELIGPVPAGEYVLRVESQHGSPGGASLLVTLRQDIFRPLYLLLAMLVLMVPYTILGAISSSFEKRRWENSTVDDKDKPSAGVGIAFIGVRAIFLVLWGFIKILASLSSNSDD